MAVIRFDIRDTPFRAIESGKKTIESRLYDEKRQALRLGDTIEFSHHDNSEVLTARIIGLLRYESFKALFVHSSPERFNGNTSDELLDEIHQFYSPEQESEFGVVGIEFELVTG